jgi:prepilin-type processing-associated H-X9-DG protein
MSLLLRGLCALLFLCLPAATLAQTGFDPAARLAAVAPFLDEHTIAVGHVDLRRLDPAAAVKTLGDLAPKEDADFRSKLTEMETGMGTMLKAFNQVGISEVYLVVSIADLPHNPPFLVAPVKAGGDADAAAEMLFEVSRLPARAALHGAAVCGGEPTIERLKTLKPTPRPELAKAFSLAGDTAAQFVFSPTDDTRRVLREMLPRLPDEIGGGSGKMLADGVQWAVISANAPPKLSLDVRVQSKDEDSAAALRGLVMNGIQILGQKANIPEAKPAEREATEAIIRLITPQVKGDQLVLSHVQTDADVQKLLQALVPMVQAARTAHGRTQSGNNLKQIAIALHNHHDVHTSFPPQAIRSKEGKPLLSWRVAILPYLEGGNLYQQFRLDEPWDSEHNKALIAQMPPVFASPALSQALQAKGMTTYLAPLSRKPPAIFKPAEAGAEEPPAGEEMIFDDPAGTKLQRIVDGTSNTILLMEANPKAAVIWTKPDDLVIDEKKLLANLAGQANGGFNAAFADGSVHFISEAVDPKMFWWMLLMNDGNPIQR